MRLHTLLPALFAFAAAPAFAQDGCLQDFESQPNIVSDGSADVFTNGASDDTGLSVVANPDPVGNASDSILQFTEDANGEIFAGFTFPFPGGSLDFVEGEPRTISMLVWGPRAEDVILKIEPAGQPDDGTGNIEPDGGTQPTPSAWTTLTYTIPDNLNGGNITIIPGITTTPAENAIWYLDSLVIGSGSCAGASAVRTLRADVATLTAAPNPAVGSTTLTVTEGTSAIGLIDAVGREVLTQQLDYSASAGTRVQVDVSGLATGSYLAVGTSADGTVLGRARIAVEQ